MAHALARSVNVDVRGPTPLESSRSVTRLAAPADRRSRVLRQRCTARTEWQVDEFSHESHMKPIAAYNDVRCSVEGPTPFIVQANSMSTITEDLSLKEIVRSNVVTARIRSDRLHFQIDGENNLHAVLDDAIASVDGGVWGLVSSCAVGDDLLYIAHLEDPDSPPRFLMLDRDLRVVKEALPHCNWASRDALFRCYGNYATCFDHQTGAKKWHVEGSDYIDQSQVHVNDDLLLLSFADGETIALDTSTGQTRWRRRALGRTALLGNLLYGVTADCVREVDSRTGDTLRERSIGGLEEAHGFFPTGRHKVYHDHIFLMASGRPGLVAVFDRHALQFKEMIRLYDMVPVHDESVIWWGGKLFVHDFGKTLHVFEDDGK